MQTKLWDLKTKTSEGNVGKYKPYFQGESAACQCSHAKYRGGMMEGQAQWCRHAFEFQYKATKAKLARYEGDSQSEGYEELREIFGCMVAMNNPEIQEICGTILFHAQRHGGVCPDDMHGRWMGGPVAEAIAKNGRIIGTAFQSVLKRGYIQETGRKRSERTKINHGREIKTYALTDLGWNRIATHVFGEELVSHEDY